MPRIKIFLADYFFFSEVTEVGFDYLFIYFDSAQHAFTPVFSIQPLHVPKENKCMEPSRSG